MPRRTLDASSRLRPSLSRPRTASGDPEITATDARSPRPRRRVGSPLWSSAASRSSPLDRGRPRVELCHPGAFRGHVVSCPAIVGAMKERARCQRIRSPTRSSPQRSASCSCSSAALWRDASRGSEPSKATQRRRAPTCRPVATASGDDCPVARGSFCHTLDPPVDRRLRRSRSRRRHPDVSELTRHCNAVSNRLSRRYTPDTTSR
jgi:hypothetical protein